MMIADLSDGCMRDAIKYLDQISVMGSVEATNVAQFLGVVSEQTLQEFTSLFRTYTQDPTRANFDICIGFLEDINTR